MKFENTDVWGFMPAIRGMRNAWESWDKSDTLFIPDKGTKQVKLGGKDIKLMQKLILAGTEHSKFMRMIHVAVDITAPSYIFSELDTYKIGTVRNSNSFMHRSFNKPFTIRDFSVEELYDILDPIPTPSEDWSLIYPYDTEEYKIYKAGEREYKIYKNGKVVSCEYTVKDTDSNRVKHFKEREVKPTQNPMGYWYLNLGGRRFRERWSLHRLIATVWLGGNHLGLDVNHKNFNRGDNSVENLEWVTRKENEQHKRSNNRQVVSISNRYEAFKNATKTDCMIDYNIRADHSSGMSIKDIREKYQTTKSKIISVLYGCYTSEYHDLFVFAYMFERIINELNEYRELYLDTKDEKYFRIMRAILPMSYNYLSTFDTNYQTLRNMYFQRRHHKLTEWSVDFVNWIKTLPYGKELIMLERGDDA